MASKIISEKNSPCPYYFPEHLRKALSAIPDYPVTSIEADSGYGKTTAMREFLRNLSGNARAVWHTCFGEPPAKTWEGICRMFGEADAEVSPKLKELYPPTLETLSDIAAVMRELSCEDEIFLVIDNYQLFQNTIPYRLMDAFSVHTNAHVHVVFVSQPLAASPRSVHNPNIHRISTKDFLFDRYSIVQYCRGAKIRISGGEIEYIKNISEGWIAAICLQTENYRKTGSLVKTNDMNLLIENTVWNRVPEKSREFLTALSLLDDFTPKQAAIMVNRPSLPDDMVRLLRGNFFIPFVEDKGMYSMHSLLRDYLRSRLDEFVPDIRREMFRRAGTALSDAGDYFGAARFYFEAGDFGAIISLPFTARYFYNNFDIGMLGFLERFVKECPAEIVGGNPMFLVMVAYFMFRNGRREQFHELAGLIRSLLDDPNRGQDSELLKIKGEFALLMSFSQFNDIVEMSAYHREALRLFEAAGERPPRSSYFGGNIPWTFGCSSVFSLYWRKTGELDRELEVMDECVPYYVTISGGHGAGGEHIMRAEAMLMRGDDRAAEIAAHRAVYRASEENQIGNRICAELVLAKLAILCGDAAAYKSLREEITARARNAGQRAVFLLGELARASLDVVLGLREEIPDWLFTADGINKMLFIHARPCAFSILGALLLADRRHAELDALTDVVMGLSSKVHFLLPQVTHLVYLSVAEKREGKKRAALETLSAALEISLPDRVYFPFAEFGSELGTLLKDLKGTFDGEKIDDMLALCERFSTGAANVVKQMAGGKSGLTPREREIALFVKEGFQTSEIAARLFISENTVKSTRKVIYGKLGIHSRMELTKIDF